MSDFIDLCGASGAVYRFRRCDAPLHHLPVAGHFALVAFDGPKMRLVELGISDNLAGETWTLRRGPLRLHLYTRLNVARSVRESDHADLRAGAGAVAAARRTC